LRPGSWASATSARRRSFGLRPDGAEEAVGYTILRNYWDHWPYEDPPPG
jgi:hypothetical protein